MSAQSAVMPRRAPKRSRPAMTLPRQSTRVPNTSNRMARGWCMGLAADQEQDDDQGNGDGLEGDAQAHEFVLATRIGTGGHADGAEQEHGDNGDHINAEEDEEEDMHRIDIGWVRRCG